jgi:hypothetical protein
MLYFSPTPVLEIDLSELEHDTMGKEQKHAPGKSAETAKEIELQPLLESVRASNVPQKVMALRMPDNSVSLAVSAQKRQTVRPPGQAPPARATQSRMATEQYFDVTGAGTASMIELTRRDEQQGGGSGSIEQRNQRR